MDRTIPRSDYERVLRDFDRKKSEELAATSNARSRDVVSSVGTETTLTVLIDLRQVMCNMESSMSKLSDTVELLASTVKAESARQQERHEQILAFMHNIANKLESASSQRMPVSLSDISVMNQASAKQTYYYRGDEIKSPEAVIGCVLMHLEQHTSRLVDVEPGFGDTTVTEFLQWGSAVRSLKGKDNDKISVIPLNSFDCSETLAVVASPVKGRPVSIQVSHVDDLCKKCPGIMGQVEEFRKRLLKCPGIVNTRKMLTLAQLNYPYVTTEGVLNVSRDVVNVKVSQNVVNLVKSMNHPQRTKYVDCILRGDRPIVAANTALRKD